MFNLIFYIPSSLFSYLFYHWNLIAGVWNLFILNNLIDLHRYLVWLVLNLVLWTPANSIHRNIILILIFSFKFLRDTFSISEAVKNNVSIVLRWSVEDAILFWRYLLSIIPNPIAQGFTYLLPPLDLRFVWGIIIQLSCLYLLNLRFSLDIQAFQAVPAL